MLSPERREDRVKLNRPQATQSSKCYAVVNANGVLLAIKHLMVNVYDSKMLEETVEAICRSAGRRVAPAGPPSKRPEKLHADEVYNFSRLHIAKHGIKHLAVRCGTDFCDRLGRYRWVVERTLA